MAKRWDGYGNLVLYDYTSEPNSLYRFTESLNVSVDKVFSIWRPGTPSAESERFDISKDSAIERLARHRRVAPFFAKKIIEEALKQVDDDIKANNPLIFCLEKGKMTQKMIDAYQNQ